MRTVTARFVALACALACAPMAGLLPIDACAQSAATASADAGALAPAPTAPAAALTQRLDAALPLQAAFTTSDGRAIRLRDEFAVGRPVILVLGYDRCPQLCGLLLQGLLEATHGTALPPSAYRIVFACIDPGDAPADAAIRRHVALDYARWLDDGAAAATSASVASSPDLDFLVGAPPAIAALADSVGYTYASTNETARAGAARFAHPAGIVVVTPGGRVSRYLMGVRFEPQELRAALVEASGGRIGTVTDRLALLCAHLDPHVGRWSTTVLAGLRVLGFTTMAALAWIVWRRRPAAPGGAA